MMKSRVDGLYDPLEAAHGVPPTTVPVTTMLAPAPLTGAVASLIPPPTRRDVNG